MIVVTQDQWLACEAPFIALWTDETYAYALYHPGILLAVELQLDTYPALPHAGAGWFQRLAYDSVGVLALGAPDTRPAIQHMRAADGRGDWPDFPMPKGEAVHQVAVGPVHADIIEPGHFRFSVIGERVLKLEARLGYAHRGILGLMRGKSPRLAARFAARVSGDATVAHSLAYAQAVEQALGATVPARAVVLRAVCAETERLANHCGDVGAIAGDAGFPFLDARFALHREQICAAAYLAFGHRLMMDVVVPGGIALDILPDGADALSAAIAALEDELPSLRRVFEDHASLQDRLMGTGIISLAQAEAFAAGGVVGRASGREIDARITPGYPPYDELGLTLALEHEGDVAARVRVRLAELHETMRLIRHMLMYLPPGEFLAALPGETGSGLGVAESFRGPVWYWVRVEAGILADLFIADPSTLQWPLLELAACTGILADFPLINKSINGSYAGVDL
jgi:Ni,Fe-hydrogenase III large subunit